MQPVRLLCCINSSIQPSRLWAAEQPNAGQIGQPIFVSVHLQDQARRTVISLKLTTVNESIRVVGDQSASWEEGVGGRRI